MARRGRLSHQANRGGHGGGIGQLPWRRIEVAFPPLKVLDEEQLERIHDASMQILETIGLDFLDDEARAILRTAGADVDPDSQRVRFDRGFIAEKIALAPSTIDMQARNPERNVEIGGRNLVIATAASAPNCSDLDGGRRPGTYNDLCNLLRLAQSFNIAHVIGGYPVEAQDLPPETRHLDCAYATITLSDKIWHPYSLGRQRISDAIDMECIARGIDRDALAQTPALFSIVNTSSPLRVDGAMLQGLMEMSRHGQVVVVTPFTLSGAMSPVTLAGALAQQNAEALAVIAFTQTVRPGAPAVYGAFTSNVDMKTGAPAFGTPEYSRAVLAGGQLARRYGLPYRSSNVNTANAPDAQAAYESMMSIWAAFLGHANLLMHGLGWLEGGLCASFEKFVIDAEMLQGVTEFLRPFAVEDDDLALDTLAEVGPGGHFFGTPHTLARYKTAFYAPILSDWRNFETWRETGAHTADVRANGIWKRMVAEFEPPSLPPGAAEGLRDFIARRKEQGPAAA